MFLFLGKITDLRNRKVNCRLILMIVVSKIQRNVFTKKSFLKYLKNSENPQKKQFYWKTALYN